LDLPELITGTQEQYESTALALARDPSRLAQLRDKLARARRASPLFDARLFARHLESAYTKMHRHYLAGKKPDDIEVKGLI
jgi:predicted O-linked N-acetylglucosamine transferase (SPINDLY family)